MDRFLVAFKDVEKHLHRTLGFPRGPAMKFSAMLEAYPAGKGLSDEHRAVLVSMAKLRNLLAHDQGPDGAPLAKPTEATVTEMEEIREALLHPPTVTDLLTLPTPALVAPTDPISQALEMVRDYDYSQFPIYDQDVYGGILTTNTIARWVAARLHAGATPDRAESVATVMGYAEGNEKVCHLPVGVLAAEVLVVFADALESGVPVTAVVLADEGRVDVAPVGVVVAGDLAALTSR